MTYQTISHALLDKVLEILGKNPAAWSHADDLFMLSIYKGRDKSQLIGLVQKMQAWENMVNSTMARVAKRTGEESDSDAAYVPALLRPRLAAGVDWQMLMGPVKKRFWEFSLGNAQVQARATGHIEYHPPEQAAPTPAIGDSR